MAFENERLKFAREHFWYCEVEVNGETHRFAENRAPLPVGFDCLAASMKTQSMRPSQIDLDGGIGIRASSSASFDEHLDYKIYGTIDKPVRFWANWRARNAGYQGGRFSLFSGYIVNNKFDESNFQRRDYVIESFSNSVKTASITAKDSLKLASNDRTKAPNQSTGVLSSDINTVTSSFTLSPSGVGNSEYPASGWVRVSDEVMSFTRSGDAMSVVRNNPPAGYQTTLSEHSINDSVQLCLYYNETIADIEYDLLVNYANVPPEQINKTQWDNEATTYLSGLYEVFITEPTGVTDLLKESGQSAPHYLYWDERSNTIPFVAINPPPATAKTVTSESNIIGGSLTSKDMPEMRASTVIVRFGQRDPTKDLDEASNYKQAHSRITPDSIAKYNGVEKFKVINSRFINNNNRVAAIRLAAKIGRRREEMPRQVTFSLDAKDGDLWVGDPVQINSDLILDETGGRYNMPAQVISAGESTQYQYTAIEHQYGESLPEDLESEDPNQRLVAFSGDIKNINLREVYNGLFPDVLDDYDIIFVFDSNCIVGSNSTIEYALDTGEWSELTTSTIKLDIRGFIVGAGGNAGAGNADGLDGGHAIILNTDIELLNTNTIGGGGGGGGGYLDRESTPRATYSGGGGAGSIAGISPPSQNIGEDGTTTTGGNSNSLAGDGGGLGEIGIIGEASTLGGRAGKAIELNGYAVTYTETGTILGEVS